MMKTEMALITRGPTRPPRCAARQLLSCAYPYPADSTQARKSYLSVPNYNAQMIGGTFVFSGWYRATGSHAGNPARLVSRKQAVTGSNSGWDISLDSGFALWIGGMAIILR